ncbi:hypothetical protein E2542_SST24895 [Spatholobus suberectus]|nr:hypothetical protein E2542_SST24895 [Spatholobus suberectus]
MLHKNKTPKMVGGFWGQNKPHPTIFVKEKGSRTTLLHLIPLGNQEEDEMKVVSKGGKWSPKMGYVVLTKLLPTQFNRNNVANHGHFPDELECGKIAKQITAFPGPAGGKSFHVPLEIFRASDTRNSSFCSQS